MIKNIILKYNILKKKFELNYNFVNKYFYLINKLTFIYFGFNYFHRCFAPDQILPLIHF